MEACKATLHGEASNRPPCFKIILLMSYIRHANLKPKLSSALLLSIRTRHNLHQRSTGSTDRLLLKGVLLHACRTLVVCCEGSATPSGRCSDRCLLVIRSVTGLEHQQQHISKKLNRPATNKLARQSYPDLLQSTVEVDRVGIYGPLGTTWLLILARTRFQLSML